MYRSPVDALTAGEQANLDDYDPVPGSNPRGRKRRTCASSSCAAQRPTSRTSTASTLRPPAGSRRPRRRRRRRPAFARARACSATSSTRARPGSAPQCHVPDDLERFSVPRHRTDYAGEQRSELRDFPEQLRSRINVVYAGANDGFLHGFRTGFFDTNGQLDGTTPTIRTRRPTMTVRKCSRSCPAYVLNRSTPAAALPERHGHLRSEPRPRITPVRSMGTSSTLTARPEDGDLYLQRPVAHMAGRRTRRGRQRNLCPRHHQSRYRNPRLDHDARQYEWHDVHADECGQPGGRRMVELPQLHDFGSGPLQAGGHRLQCQLLLRQRADLRRELGQDLRHSAASPLPQHAGQQRRRHSLGRGVRQRSAATTAMPASS